MGCIWLFVLHTRFNRAFRSVFRFVSESFSYNFCIVYTQTAFFIKKQKALGDFQIIFQTIFASFLPDLRPMTMETRCSKVIFPTYSKKKPAEDTLVPPLWGTREKVCFSRIICSRCSTRWNLRFHVENCQHADQKQLTRR